MNAQQYVFSFRAMGSEFNVWVETEGDGPTIVRQVPAWVEEIEARLTRFRPQSELNALNARSGQWVTVSDVLYRAIEKALHAAALTDGLYNPLILPALVAAGYTRSFDEIRAGAAVEDSASEQPVIVPDWRSVALAPKRRAVRLPAGAQIDLGGTAKGWTAELIANRLAAYGPCLVDAGGDLVARGTPQNQPGWVVAVAEPGAADDTPPILSVALADQAVATTGIDYRRWRQGGKLQHHIIDPRTGQPAQTDVQSVTVICPTATAAEAYAKAILLLGSEAGLEWVNQQPQHAALVVRTTGAVVATQDFMSHTVALA
ncbi:MAG TPA: FAD:protein FMN transferase [Aggregatilinea sp.]|uniref:FAD:protein FMN transferase n=1 Tax=Aggregatilinea sp. TaxID=2806333 RepID=UPI002C407B56|nr:FAD:protein FMN transferase [Aggregatilinea sp.]HML21382.1 FAD:protein FMN transferase [Aggregatilinea sp.]